MKNIRPLFYTCKVFGFVLFCVIFLVTDAQAAPTISNVTTSTVAEHGELFAGTTLVDEGYAANFTVNWETNNEPSTAKVVYGTTATSLTSSSRTNPLLSTKHSIRVENQVFAGRTYFYKVVSRNALGEETQSAVNSIDIPSNSEWWEVGHDSWMKRFALADWSPDTDWIGLGNVYRKVITNSSTPTGGWISFEYYPFKGTGLTLLVNGQQVGTWPYGYSVPSFDISPYLVSGTNTILIGQELGTNFTFQFLAEGEISYTDGTTVQLNSTPGNWEKATVSGSNWASYSGPWSNPTIGYDTAFGSPYQKWLINGLPQGTPRRSAEFHYSQNLARRNRIKESSISELLQSRIYLSLESSDKSLALATATVVEEELFTLEPLFSQAQSLIAAGNYSSAQTALGQTDTILSQAELKVSVAKSFLDAISSFWALSLANNHLNNIQVSSGLNAASTNLQSVRTDIGGGQYNAAQTKLASLTTNLKNLETTLENSSGYKVSLLNNSDKNALGFLRMRKSDIYFNQYRLLTNGNWIGLKPDPTFANVSTDWKSEFRESQNFLSPFTIINISGNSYSFGSTATGAALKIGSSTVIRSLPGSIKSTTEQMGENWLLVWNANTPAQTYIYVFERQPEQISYASGDITVTRAGGVGEIIVYALYADGSSLSGNTSNIGNWSTTLANGSETGVIQDINFWSRALLKVPLNYVELQREAGSNTEVIIKYRYHDISGSDAWNITPITIAPLPPVLTYARSVNYPGINVTGTVRNTNYLTRSGNTSTWGPYEFVEADALQFSYPRFTDTNTLQGINTSQSGNAITDEAAALGFNAIRDGFGDILDNSATQPAPCAGDNTPENSCFDLDANFASQLTPKIDYANSKGLRVIVIVWNAIRDPSILENNPGNQTKFINSWQQIAQTLASKQVVYDLVNEPEFTNVANYNTLMDQTVAAIRSVDPNNPIAIEGYRDFARNFTGMTKPNYPNVWFEHHPYPNMYDQAYNTVDAYYPGFERGSTYADRDTYFEDFWQSLVRRKLQDPALGLYSGEFGVQEAPKGTKVTLVQDMADMNRRYGIHQTYFTLTGWTMFDLYAGSGAIKDVQTDVVAALLGNPVTPSPSESPTPSPAPTVVQILSSWLLATFDQNGDGKVNVMDFAELLP